MQPNSIIVPSPCAPSKAVQKTFDVLTQDVSAVAEKRIAATGKHAQLSAHFELLKQRAAHVSTAAESAVVEAERAAVNVELLVVESEQLKLELPLMQRALELFPLANESRHREKAVADQVLQLAKQHVREVFRRDFGEWAISEQAMERFLTQHPIVVGAMEKLQAIDTSQDQYAQEAAAEQCKQAKLRLDNLNAAIVRMKAREAEARANANTAKHRADAQAEAEKTRQNKLDAERRAVEAEARRRLAAVAD